jgi:hypothetical protein
MSSVSRVYVVVADKMPAKAALLLMRWLDKSGVWCATINIVKWRAWLPPGAGFLRFPAGMASGCYNFSCP